MNRFHVAHAYELAYSDFRALQVLRVGLADIALIAHALDPMLVHDRYRQKVAPQAYRTP